MVKVGARVRLLNTRDYYSKLRTGDAGTVESIDYLGTIRVKWDKGGNLCLIEGEGYYEVIK